MVVIGLVQQSDFINIVEEVIVRIDINMAFEVFDNGVADSRLVNIERGRVGGNDGVREKYRVVRNTGSGGLDGWNDSQI